MAKTVSRVLNAAMLGPEPEFSGESDRVTLMRSFNWYSYSNTLLDSKKWILEWMVATGRTEKQITIYRQSNHSDITQTKASLSRMLSRGLEDDALAACLNAHIDLVLDAHAPKPVSEPVVHISDIPNKLIMQLDEQLDIFYNSNYKAPEDIKSMITAICAARQQSKCKEAIALYAAIHEEVKDGEGYEKLKTVQRNRYLKFLDLIIDTLAKIVNVTKTRKPRKKKPKKLVYARIASQLRYLKDHELASSVDPTQLFDTKTIWLYNPSTRKLAKYVKGSDNLSVKGQSIINFDEKKSFMITIRKPEEAIPLLIAKLLTKANKYIASLKVKKMPATGRINDKTLLLRVQR